jgi:rubredoxin
MASLTNCKARDHEICPLSLAPINQSPLPLGDNISPCDLVLNPMKPDHKCAQLACGHRFNAIWLIYHFIEGNTFRCPVCRAGETNFRFQRNELPPAILKLLELIEAAKKKGTV